MPPPMDHPELQRLEGLAHLSAISAPAATPVPSPPPPAPPAASSISFCTLETPEMVLCVSSSATEDGDSEFHKQPREGATDGGDPDAQKEPDCNIGKEDVPSVIQSFALFGSFLIYGACVAILGASIPEISQKFGMAESSFGVAFTTRGIGYLVGTFLSAFLAENVSFGKTHMTCISLIITGVMTGVMAATSDFSLLLFFFFGKYLVAYSLS
jgi:hypothetical protein